VATVPSIGRAAPESAGSAGAPAEATRSLYERFGRQIFAYCLVQLRNREEAEDAMQTTFLNAFRALERGVVPDLESAWLYKIAQHVCLTRRRSWSRRRRVESPEDFDNVHELLGAPMRDTGEVEGLTEALRKLPEQQRRAILLREWQGLTYKEIAAEMQLSQAAVETLIFRARRSLAQTLEKLRASGDMGSIAAAIKSLLVGAGTKVAVTLVTVATTSVVAATPAARHQVLQLVNEVSHVAVAPAKPDHAKAKKDAASSATASSAVTTAARPSPAHKANVPARGAAGKKQKMHAEKKATIRAGVLSHSSGPTAAQSSTSPSTPSTTVPASTASSPSSAVTTPGATTAGTTTTAQPAPPAPAVTPAIGGFSPMSGAPGTVVQLSGHGFTGATAVRFYGTNADYIVYSDTSIGAKVPAGAISGPITIVSPTAGDITSSASFTVTTPPSPATQPSSTVAPSVGGFSPASGAVGTAVQLSGKGFTGATAVRFYGTSASYVVNSDTSITTRVPAGATSGPITVVSPTAGDITSSASFDVTASTTPTAPTFYGTSPTSGSVGAAVSIGGSGFTGATAVRFNGTSADFTVSSDTLIATHVPAGATTGPITVVTPKGTVTSTGNFTVTSASPPTINGLSPSSGAAGSTVAIGGAYLTGATAVRFNGTSANFTVGSDSTITAQVPAGATTGAVTVVTPGGTATSGTFTVTAAGLSIQGSSPRSGQVGTSVLIVGSGFTGATAVRFDGTPASFTVGSDTQITATVPSGATTGSLSVTTPSGTTTSTGIFTVTVAAAPAISGFSPSSAAVGTQVQLSGSGFTGATSVKFNGVSADFSVGSDGAITAVVPTAATSGPVSVTTANGTGTSSGSFTVTH